MTVLNLKEFNAALQAASARLTREQLPTFHRVISLQVLRGVVLKTPVGNPDKWQRRPPRGSYVGGTARGNWQVNVNTVPSGNFNLQKQDAAGASTIATEGVKLAKLPPFSVVFVSNNLPYIERLERGWSQQAPAGMVGVTFQEIITRFGP